MGTHRSTLCHQVSLFFFRGGLYTVRSHEGGLIHVNEWTVILRLLAARRQVIFGDGLMLFSLNAFFLREI